jgi:hypothetical protein
MPNTTPTRKPLTDATWADHGTVQGNSQIAWPALSDLEHQLAEARGWDIEIARALMYSVNTLMPIVLTWDTQLNGAYGEPGRIERTTTTVIVNYVTNPHKDSPAIRIRHCGFGHEVRMERIVSAKVPETTVEYI